MYVAFPGQVPVGSPEVLTQIAACWPSQVKPLEPFASLIGEEERKSGAVTGHVWRVYFRSVGGGYLVAIAFTGALSQALFRTARPDPRCPTPVSESCFSPSVQKLPYFLHVEGLASSR